MSGLVPQETQVARREAARLYAGLDDAAWRRLRRAFRKKVDPVEFALMWRDGVPVKAIADRFGLRDADYVSAVRRRMGLPPRGKAARPTAGQGGQE
ncbi:MAG: hypothetical protein ING19_02675 [Azospirillum sp.]|nr:hypothetical protein [Azospirillum sp.]